MQKNIYLFNVTLAEFYRHDCRISESSLVSLTTNTLHNLFCDYCVLLITRVFLSVRLSVCLSVCLSVSCVQSKTLLLVA